MNPNQVDVAFLLPSEPKILSMFGVYRKFFRFRKKNLNDFWPSYLKATHRKLVKADPSKATSADAMSELGRGSNISRTMPMRGAPITIEVNEYFFEGDEKSSPKDPDEEESLHLWRNSAFSKHSGQYSATIT